MKREKLALVAASVLVCFVATGCMTYGSPVTDEVHDVVYVPWAKKSLGMTTKSGILTCVPTRERLLCIDGPEVVSSLPASGYCHQRSCGQTVASETEQTYATGRAGGDFKLKVFPDDVRAVTPEPAPAAEELLPGCTSAAMVKMHAIDLSAGGGLSAEQAAESLNCWKGKRVRVLCRDKNTYEGTLASSVATPTPFISIWTAAGMTTRPLADVVRIERM